MRLFGKSSRICIEVRDTCNDTSIRQGIGEVLTFMERISGLAQLNFSDEGKRYHLSELDVNLSSVNWTKFFIMTTPPDMHSYFLADPLVEVPSMRYTKRIDKLLQRTPKRVFTNYVILHYILSWIQYLDDEYRQLMEDTEELAERLVRDVMAAFEEGIKENKWMTNEQKKVQPRTYTSTRFFELDQRSLRLAEASFRIVFSRVTVNIFDEIVSLYLHVNDDIVGDWGNSGREITLQPSNYLQLRPELQQWSLGFVDYVVVTLRWYPDGSFFGA
ncbi:hypothetical protein RB195_017746 [Necator americanus]|uniref:Peptidase M13 N-terminal domain-containing protein n=1 Tax=Necator americanus TaxID=51031 RepID=A0ABR1C7M0_NECAM